MLLVLHPERLEISLLHLAAGLLDRGRVLLVPPSEEELYEYFQATSTPIAVLLILAEVPLIMKTYR